MLKMFMLALRQMMSLLMKADKIFVVHLHRFAVGSISSIIDQSFDRGSKFVHGDVEVERSMREGTRCDPVIKLVHS